MWICKKCSEENEDTFDSCWSCQAERSDGSAPPIPTPDESPEPEATVPAHVTSALTHPSVRRAVAVVIAAIGLVLIIIGITSLNSIESQLQRRFGGSDDVATVLLVIGILALLAGLFFAIAMPASNSADRRDSASEHTETRLRRLQDLRQKGVITRAEYEQRRTQILSKL
jgi:uncharacterized membrane protein